MLTRNTLVEHHIDTGESPPLRSRPYRIFAPERRAIQDYITDILEKRAIEPSSSLWSSPMVLVKKKDHTWRFCVDYRTLNKVTQNDVYPLPQIDDTFDMLQGSSYFSSMDLRSENWQVPLASADRPKTAFITPDGPYIFNIMPFGICNAPATFKRMMDALLRGLT